MDDDELQHDVQGDEQHGEEHDEERGEDQLVSLIHLPSRLLYPVFHSLSNVFLLHF